MTPAELRAFFEATRKAERDKIVDELKCAAHNYSVMKGGKKYVAGLDRAAFLVENGLC